VDVSGGNLLGRWTRTLGPESEIQLQAYYDQTFRRIPNTLAEDLDTFDLDFQHRFSAGDAHNVVWGVGYRMIDDEIVNGPGLAFLPPLVTREWFSGFVQDEITLVPDQLELTLGTKAEHNEYSGLEVQPGIRLSWNPAEGQSVWVAVSRAVRTPSRIDREFFVPRDPPFTLLQGGPDFDSEKLTAYELGYRVQLASRVSAGLATFYHDYAELRSLERVNPATPFPVVIGNGLTGQSYGAEFTVDYHVHDAWRLHAGLTRLLIDFRARPGSTDTSGGSSEAHDAGHQFFLRSSVDLPHGWEFDVAYRHVGEITDQGVPSYGELDARLAWRVSDELEISLVGQNLLHDQHAEFGAAAARQEIERSIHGRITWRH
jgi:iron complex outermembrane receptor protein